MFYTITLYSLVSVTECRGKAVVCQGYKVLSPDICAPQRHPNLYRHSGYCDEGRTELTEISGMGITPLQNSLKFRVLWHGRIELTEVTGRYKNVVPVPRVW